MEVLSHRHKELEAVFQEEAYVLGMATKIKECMILPTSRTYITVVVFIYTTHLNKLLKHCSAAWSREYNLKNKPLPTDHSNCYVAGIQIRQILQTINFKLPRPKCLRRN